MGCWQTLDPSIQGMFTIQNGLMSWMWHVDGTFVNWYSSSENEWCDRARVPSWGGEDRGGGRHEGNHLSIHVTQPHSAFNASSPFWFLGVISCWEKGPPLLTHHNLIERKKCLKEGGSSDGIYPSLQEILLGIFLGAPSPLYPCHSPTVILNECYFTTQD